MKSCLLLILHTDCVVSLSGVACVACCVAVPFVRWDSSNFTRLLVQLFVLLNIDNIECYASIIWIVLLLHVIWSRRPAHLLVLFNLQVDSKDHVWWLCNVKKNYWLVLDSAIFELLPRMVTAKVTVKHALVGSTLTDSKKLLPWMRGKPFSVAQFVSLMYALKIVLSGVLHV